MSLWHPLGIKNQITRRCLRMRRAGGGFRRSTVRGERERPCYRVVIAGAVTRVSAIAAAIS